ncbi:MAG: hypothetical protein ACYC1D_06960 [Acidimicrobiales bacterium]
MPITNLQAGHFLLPGAIASAVTVCASFAFMAYVWVKNFGSRPKNTR